MSERVNFSYEPTADSTDLLATVSVFSDKPHGRSQLTEDLERVGFRVLSSGDADQLLYEDPALLGDVVVLECVSVNAREMAALAHLDQRMAQSGAQLIVATSLDSLGDIFACFDQSAPQFLVAPSRAEMIIGVGRISAGVPHGRVRELSQEDRTALVRLSQQVEQIARQLEGLSERSLGGENHDGVVKDAKPAFRGFASNKTAEPLVRPSLPDPRVVRAIIRRRRARARYFEAELFADPAWDILLDLTAADAERVRVSVTSLCIASGVPATTALRWIGQMTEAGLLMRVEDTTDKRRVFISLTDKARNAMAQYFADEVGQMTGTAA